MDLSVIKARLDNRFYRRSKAIEFDVCFNVINGETYNGPGSPISRTAQKVKEKCVKIIRQKGANVFLKNRHFRIGGWDYFAQERSNQKDKRSSQETGADYRKNAKKETLHWSS